MKVILDEDNPDTYVISLLNGKKYTRITHTHTKKFGLNIEQYCNKFNILRQDILCNELRKKLSWTMESCIEMYGHEEGTSRWNEYRRKQSESNTFEYKRNKHNWTEIEFREYNLSRASTRNNFIKRHGESEGVRRWENYCKLQSYAGSSKEYFIDKYGEKRGSEVWEEICQRKSNTLSTFIDRYGLEEGRRRFQSYIDNKVSYYSAISQELFKKLDKDNADNVYYACKNKEYSVYDEVNGKIYFYDFVDCNAGKCIEFNGDQFHGNPKLYSSSDCPNPFKSTLTCEDIWNHDKIKNNCIKEQRSFDVLIVWERDYRNNPDDVVLECKKFLGYE